MPDDRTARVPLELEIAASTAWLRARRRELLVDSPRGAVLGRLLLTFRGLAEACAAESGAPLRGELGEGALIRLVQHCSRGLGTLGAEIESRPGLARSLAATLRDLRDAGVGPGALGPGTPLRQLYAAVENALAALADEGLVDRIGLFRLARQGAAAWLHRRGVTRITLRGATELVGSVGDLVEALHREVPLRFEQLDWGHAFAEEIRARWPWSFEPRATPVGSGAPAPTPICVRCASPREEIELVSREILVRLEQDVAPEAIAVVARNLADFSPWVPGIFERAGIPFSSSLQRPVLRWPRVRARLTLARVLVRDLPREDVLELLASPRLRNPKPGALLSLAERAAREGRVRGGATDWLAALATLRPRRSGPSHAPQHLAQLRRLIEQLAEEGNRLREAPSWAGATRVLQQAAERWLDDVHEEPDAAADRAAEETLAPLELLDAVDRVAGNEAGSTSPQERLGMLQRALEGCQVREHDGDHGGVRILDALQARGLHYEHLFVIGLNHGRWPLELQEDPFLRSDAREELRLRTGRPLAAPARQESESRFLLGLLVAQAERSVQLSWHERDASGHECAPSRQLREMHLEPTDSSRRPREDLPPTVEALCEAVQCVPETAFEALVAELWPEPSREVHSAVRRVRATDAWRSDALDLDGGVGPEALEPERTYSPSLLERLGHCPQRVFFTDLLGVSELAEGPPHALDRAEAGTLVHAVLQRIYARLYADGDLAPTVDPVRALTRARSLLREEIRAQAPRFAAAIQRRHPSLWEASEMQLVTAMERFLQHDLSRLLPAGLHGLGVEVPIALELNGIHVRGKADRVIETAPGRLVVGDYKTSKDVRRHVSATEIARGRSLQIPLYALALAREHDGRSIRAEVLAVPLRPERVSDTKALEPRTLELEEIEERTEPPLRVLVALLHEGRFPFHRNGGCTHCPFDVACRKDHAPSRERVRTASVHSDFFALQDKRA
ncbi:MAG: PD-(D/E)XK nuclease family protein [Myxococcota bacterium]